MSIEVKTISVEAHHSIEIMKRYHESLRRIYSIIISEMLTIDLESVLQMSFKTLNDSIESDDFISTLLIFDAYSRLTNDALTPTIIQRAIAMRKAMNEVKQFMTIRRVNDALNIRNESISQIYNLSLNSSVLIFREDTEKNHSET
jgi:hypothetical protein